MAEFELDADGEGVAVVRVTGEVDLAVVDDLLAAGRQGLAQGHDLRLDLAGVSFIDSTGLGALVRLRSEAEAVGGSMTLVDVPASLVRLLHITGLQDTFTIVAGDGPDEPT